MLGLAGVLAGYVAQGVRGAKPDVRSAGPAARPTASPTAKGSRGGASSSSAPAGSRSAAPKPSASFNPQTNTYTFTNRILFEINSSALRPEARKALQEVVAALKGQKRYGEVVVTGYTDDTGGTTTNLRLSLARAQVVKTFLMPLLPVEHFTVRAYGRGETNFAVQNTSEANREQNRRVQIVVPKPSNS